MPSASHPKAMVEGLLPELRGKLPKAAGRVDGEAEAGNDAWCGGKVPEPWAIGGGGSATCDAYDEAAIAAAAEWW